MEFRSFYGSTIREALDAARRELGPDAAILASRRAETAPGEPVTFEAVCGVVPAADEAKSAPARMDPRKMQATSGTPVARRIPASESKNSSIVPASVARTPAAPVSKPAAAAGGSNSNNSSRSDNTARPDNTSNPGNSASRGLASLRNRVDNIRQAIVPDSKKATSAIDGLRSELLLDGFDESLATEIVAGVRERLRVETPEAAISSELEARLMTDASLGRDGAKRKVLALVGPPGVGKTSLLVKIAVRYGLTGKRPVRLVSLDGIRVGGADALRTFGASMGVPVDVVETGAAMVQAVEAHSDAGLVLIDTPGLSPSDLGASEEMITSLVRHPEIDVHLVVSAMMSAANLRTTMGRFRALMPSKIGVTQTDAAAPGRTAVALALNHELPMSFAGTGPGVPGDIAECSIALLSGRTGRQVERGRSAVSAA